MYCNPTVFLYIHILEHNVDVLFKEEEEEKKAPVIRKLNLIWRKKLVKCYIWSTVLYGNENWTLRKVDQKYVASCVLLEKDGEDQLARSGEK